MVMELAMVMESVPSMFIVCTDRYMDSMGRCSMGI
jgi:hypothetical protein